MESESVERTYVVQYLYDGIEGEPWKDTADGVFPATGDGLEAARNYREWYDNAVGDPSRIIRRRVSEVLVEGHGM